MSNQTKSNITRCNNPFCTGGVTKGGAPTCKKCLSRICFAQTPKCLYPSCDEIVKGILQEKLKTDKFFQPKRSFCIVHYNKNFVPCKKLAEGFCTFKDKCRFNHRLCQFHAKGGCKLGKFCRNVHIEITKKTK